MSQPACLVVLLQWQHVPHAPFACALQLMSYTPTYPPTRHPPTSHQPPTEHPSTTHTCRLVLQAQFISSCLFHLQQPGRYCTAAMFNINSAYVVRSGGTGRDQQVNQQEGAADSKSGKELGERSSRPFLRMHQNPPLSTHLVPTWLPSARLQVLPSSFHSDAER